MHKYLIEVETMEHRYIMTNQTAPEGAQAVRDAVSKVGGLRGTLVACAKDAPEFGDTCKRELVG